MGETEQSRPPDAPVTPDAPKKAKTVLDLRHAAVVLRIDEWIDGELGTKIARQVGAIVLSPGLNEVDAAMWARWCEQHEDSPFLRDGLIREQGKQADGDGSSSEV